jgi:acetate kinase
MNILVFNCGSSSLTYKVFKFSGSGNIETLLSGKAHRVGVTGTEPSFIENTYEGRVSRNEALMQNHGQAAAFALEYIKGVGISIGLAGHRFVHGGNYFKNTAFIEKETLHKLQLCLPLAPIHNPISLEVIEQARKYLPGIKQYVSFDSAFHSTISYFAYTYCLPKKVIEKYGFRKYGFHGLSYSYVIAEASRLTGDDIKKTKIVACHLGTGGSSVAAINGGSSVDNSMGYSPLPGLVMSTRSGDIDPLLSIYLMNIYGLRPDDLMEMLNKKSGLLGVSGFSSDITDILSLLSSDKNKQKQGHLAIGMYVHRLKKYIGGYAAVLGGIDMLIFTDDIGVRNPGLRNKICENMGWCGIELDEKKNLQEKSGDRAAVISAAGSKVKVVVVPTKEELVICLEGVKLIQ